MIPAIDAQKPLIPRPQEAESGNARLPRPPAGTAKEEGPPAAPSDETAAAPSDGPLPSLPADIAGQVEARFNEILPELLGLNSRLSILEHEETGKFIYRSVDIESGEVLKQWPEEEILRLIEFFRDLEGLLVDTRV